MQSVIPLQLVMDMGHATATGIVSVTPISNPLVALHALLVTMVPLVQKVCFYFVTMYLRKHQIRPMRKIAVGNNNYLNPALRLICLPARMDFAASESV